MGGVTNYLRGGWVNFHPLLPFQGSGQEYLAGDNDTGRGGGYKPLVHNITHVEINEAMGRL